MSTVIINGEMNDVHFPHLWVAVITPFQKLNAR